VEVSCDTFSSSFPTSGPGASPMERGFHRTTVANSFSRGREWVSKSLYTLADFR
jgi:hypothetical protein